jgi:hypothetical protein
MKMSTEPSPLLCAAPESMPFRQGEVGRGGESDESQVDWASSENRALLTFTVGHFAALHTMRMAEGRHHAGIIVSSQRPIGDVIRRLLRLARDLDAESMRDRLEFLGDW